MSLEQKIKGAYRKWQSKAGKMGFKTNRSKELHSKMVALKNDLCRFADKFERKFVNARNLTGKELEQMRKIIGKEFVHKILTTSDWFEKYIFTGGVTDDIRKKLEPIGNYMRTVKTEFYDRDYRTGSKLSLLDYLEYRIFYFGRGKKMLGDIKGFEQEKQSAYFLLDFLLDVFKAMRDVFLEVSEKVVSDEEYFYDGDNGNYFYKAVEWFFPDFLKKKDKHTIDSVPQGIKIFPTPQSPKPSEVKQAQIGDCYLVAALIALAKDNPEAIKGCFVQGLDNIEKENIIKIRLYKKGEMEAMPRPFIMNIDKRKVIMPDYVKENALWPKLIEKAYAVIRQKEGRLLDAGRPEKIMTLITGKFEHRVNNIDEIMQILKNKKTGDQNVYVCDFKSDFTTKDVKCNEDVKIFGRHAYAVLGIREIKGKEYVRLINPWKAGGRSVEHSPKSKEGGHIAMPIDDFKKHFYTLNFVTDTDW